MRILVASADVDIYNSNWDGLLEKGLRAVKLASNVDDPLAESSAYFDVSTGRMFHGEPELAESAAAASVAAAERLRHHFYLARALFVRGTLARLRGDWEAARGFSERALATSPDEPRNLYQRLIEEYELGNFADGGALLRRLLDVQRLTGPGPTLEHGFLSWARPWIALTTGETGGLDAAADTADTILSAPSVTPTIAECARRGQGLLAVVRGDAAAAEEIYTGFDRTGLGLLLECGDDRFLGLLAGIMGRFDDAATHFEDELAVCRRLGYRPQLAWTCSDYAEMLLDRTLQGSTQAREGDRERAIELQDEALAIARELGMRPLTERILARRDILRA